VAVIALAHAGEAVSATLRTASLIAGGAFVGLVAVAATLLASPRGAVALGRVVETVLRPVLRVLGRPRELHVSEALLDIRRECADLVAKGWLQMSLSISGYVALQALLLGFCLHLTGGGNTWVEVLAAFAVERLLTVVPITPGGVGVADLGLVGVLIALGGDPASVTAAALLYRAFVFAVEIPVGGGALGMWLLGRRRDPRPRPVPLTGQARRIAHVTDVFLPHLGGIETHVDDLVRHQRARGLKADVLTPARGSTDDPPWVRRLSAARARRVLGEYDVVHVHASMLSPYGISLARAAIAAGVPTLVTVHTMWAGAGGILRLAAMAMLRRWPVAWTAVSTAAATTFQRSLGRIDVDVLPNAVDVAAWRRTPVRAGAGDAVREELTRGPAPVTLVSVMRLMPRKRPMRLLRMFEQVLALTGDDARLVVVGDGPLRGRMERYVRRHHLGDRVRITGRVTRGEVRDELLASSVYVAPAAKESFGIAALEARCVGLPVVANRHSGVTEFVRDRVDGLLVGDDAEMVVALADLVRDPVLRQRIAAHNWRVAPRFDWADVLDRTDELYRVAADRASAGRPAAATSGTLAAQA